VNYIKNPKDIETKSFEIIEDLIGERSLDPLQAPIIKRVIHTTADFEYLDQLIFSNEAVEKAHAILKKGAVIVTDTSMALAGINKKALAKAGCQGVCFIGSEEVASLAKKNQTTRSATAVHYAFQQIEQPIIFVCGNAPTALIELYDLIQAGGRRPELIIGVPVGFVNVVESKELILSTDVPHIIAKGRKGGSNVAAAICNALLYQIVSREDENPLKDDINNKSASH